MKYLSNCRYNQNDRRLKTLDIIHYIFQLIVNTNRCTAIHYAKIINRKFKGMMNRKN